MNKLSCEVTSCYHNCHGGCCLDSIKVEGPAANTSDETICGSFVNSQGENSAHEADRRPRPELEVRCSAVVCKYNDNGECDADKVCIACNCGCGARSECSTFKL